MAWQKTLQPGETVLHRAWPSRWGLVVPVGLTVIALIGAGIAFKLGQPLVAIAAGVIALLAGVWAAVRWVKLASSVYVLTDRRVLKQEGLLARTSKDAYLDKVNNVEHFQTLPGRLFGFGDLEIDTASEHGATTFHRIANPIEFKSAILAAADQERSGRMRPAVAQISGADRLRELKRLLDEGLIDETEFKKKRAELVDAL
ncbi:MAG TPA: PH domain-containing protein [Thermoanaerobaculia bacterium]|jgi:uncharacterized membrane protein YdbT with pleckstrin-like domain|nr:PH domain-containing protein [Thermoanaerobaculia bacterium]